MQTFNTKIALKKTRGVWCSLSQAPVGLLENEYQLVVASLGCKKYWFHLPYLPRNKFIIIFVS